MSLPTFSDLYEAYSRIKMAPAEGVKDASNAATQGALLSSTLNQRKSQAQSNKAKLDEIMQRTALEKARTDALSTGQTTPVFSIDPKTHQLTKIGEVPKGSHVEPPGFGMESLAGVREKQFQLTDLPSRSPANSVPGVSSRALYSARQGKSLIAKAGSPQAIALASSDMARLVQGSAPTMELLKGASFSKNAQSMAARLKQLVTSDPGSPDIPGLRKQMWEMFSDLEDSARPSVERALKEQEDTFAGSLPKNWETTKKRELGEVDFPTIPTDLPDFTGVKPSKPKGKGMSVEDALGKVTGSGIDTGY